MPVTITRTPVETEHRDTGYGGKPPADRRPTGGGGDGDWENHKNDGHGPRELLTRYRMAVFFALSGDLLLFMALVSAFFVRQTSGHINAANVYVMDWRPLEIPPILWINTALLLLSSLTMEAARRHVFREYDVMDEWLGLGRPAMRRAAPWLLATAVLGMLFLAGQWMAWVQLTQAGVYLASNPSRDFFYLITGVHAVHLAIGILALGAALIAVFGLRRMETRQIVVDCSAWYWHSMSLFWIFLFGILVFCQ